MPLRALLFDFDGVLADTENVHVAAWQRTFAELGWEVSDAVCARAAEEDDRAFLASLFAERGITSADIAGWVLRKQSLAFSLLNDAPRLYPGVAALAHAVRGKVRLAVVTGTWRSNVEVVLRASGLAPAFELIVAKEDVAAVKPAPDGYTLALKRLGLPPAAAVALEDSPSGVAAAIGAGVRCVAVGHRRPAGDWVGSAVYIADLVETARVLGVLGLSRRSVD
jgi:HAD superfamily hydrolase (TIGR01509 family)